MKSECVCAPNYCTFHVGAPFWDRFTCLPEGIGRDRPIIRHIKPIILVGPMLVTRGLLHERKHSWRIGMGKILDKAKDQYGALLHDQARRTGVSAQRLDESLSKNVPP